MRPAPVLPGLAVAVALAAASAARAQVPQVVERVEVSRVVVDVHVLADDGRPIAGLAAADLRVSVDGKPVKIESLRWTTGSVARADAASPLPASDLAVELPGHQPGRLVLLLFQKDLEPSRIEGLMPMLRQAEVLVAGLGPDDRVAVASFEHHLELWTDFTTDRAAVRAILTRSILFAGRSGEIVTGEPLAAVAVLRSRRRPPRGVDGAGPRRGRARPRRDPGAKVRRACRARLRPHDRRRRTRDGARGLRSGVPRGAPPAVARARHGVLSGCDPRGFPHARRRD